MLEFLCAPLGVRFRVFRDSTLAHRWLAEGTPVLR
jgi:hypothetical protein